MSAASSLWGAFSRGALMPERRHDRVEERVYKSLWHLLIAAVGVYELRNHKTKTSKVLACGLIAFHLDAALADALDAPPLARRILNWVCPNDGKRGARKR